MFYLLFDNKGEPVFPFPITGPQVSEYVDKHLLELGQNSVFYVLYIKDRLWMYKDNLYTLWRTKDEYDFEIPQLAITNALLLA